MATSTVTGSVLAVDRLTVKLANHRDVLDYRHVIDRYRRRQLIISERARTDCRSQRRIGRVTQADREGLI